MNMSAVTHWTHQAIELRNNDGGIRDPVKFAEYIHSRSRRDKKKVDKNKMIDLNVNAYYPNENALLNDFADSYCKTISI